MDRDRKKVLVVDDRLDWLLKCTDLLSEKGYDVATCGRPEMAIKVFSEYKPDAVLLDVKMPGRGGLEILKDIRSTDPWVVVIMLSGFGDTDTVVEAMKLEADHFVDKNSDLRKIPLVIEKELRSKGIEVENIRLKANPRSGVVLIRDIIGESPGMLQVKEQIRTHANSKDEVLLTGPTGVGKDFVAKAFHYESRRRNQPFVNLRCPELPPSLIESELFGHERGAFTDAYRSKEGVIEAAKKGTVLLNDFVDIPLYAQAKFLGVLELDGVYTPVGGEGKERRTSARFMAATNKDLNQALEERTLREDLLYRLKKVWVRIPPLKERGEDVILLAQHFIERECRKLNKPAFALSPRSKVILRGFDWPGNVRQLENLIGVMVQSGQEEITEPPGFSPVPADAGNSGGIKLNQKLKQNRERQERAEIESALSRYGGNRKKTAEYLGMSYRSLLYKMARYGLREKF
jgi:two-component system response regulator AtoC